MNTEVYRDGLLRRRHDDATRTVTSYDESGAVIETRPYTPDENVAADAAAQAEEDARLAEERRQTEAAIIDATVVLMENAHTDGEIWTQPTGAHNAYKVGVVVEHNGKTWENITPANVWEPGVSGWREVVTGGGVAEWIKPTGAHDAYQIDDRVMYNGQTWVSTAADNVWAPGVYGWVVV